MFKKVFGSLLVLFLLVSSGFAVIQGLEKDKQSVVKVGEGITVPQGAEIKSAVAVGGPITVLGHVMEDVVAVGDSVYLKDSAQVDGNVVAVGGRVMKDAGAINKGDIVEVSIPTVSPMLACFTSGNLVKSMAYFWALSLMVYIILAIIAVALFTPQLGRVSGAIEKKFWRSFWGGVLALVLFVPIIALLAISIVGILLIPVFVIVVVMAGMFGYFAVGHVIGKKIFHASRVYGKSMMTETVFGVVLLSLLSLVPIVGSIIKLIAVLCGLGAAWETRLGLKG